MWLSVSSISHYTEISEGTIKYWFLPFKKGGDILKVQEGRGRKKSLSEQDLERMEEEVKEDPYMASTRQLGPDITPVQRSFATSLHDFYNLIIEVHMSFLS